MPQHITYDVYSLTGSLNVQHNRLQVIDFLCALCITISLPVIINQLTEFTSKSRTAKISITTLIKLINLSK